jgi:hypothetical protein
MNGSGIEVFTKGFEINNNILFGFYSSKGNFSSVLVYDENFDLEDTVKIDKIRICNIVKPLNSDLYTFGYELPFGYDGDSVHSYKLMRSTDNANSWEKLPIDWPIESHRVNEHYFQSVKVIYEYKEFVLIPVIWPEKTILHYYNTITGEYGKIELPFFLSRSTEAIFTFQGYLFAISQDNTIYYTVNALTGTIEWESFHISEYLNDWSDYEPDSKEIGKDIIYSARADENQIFLTILKSKLTSDSQPNFTFSSNIVKLIKEKTTTVKETIDSDKAYLWYADPFPTPSFHIVRSKIYWNSLLSIKNAKFGLYDSFGDEIPNSDIAIDPINEYSAYITWNCHGFSPGVYFIRVTLNNESMTIPVLVGGR